MLRSVYVPALALVAVLAGCGDAREDARNELRRLHGEVQQHAARFGRYPDTIDAARPAGPTNLPHTAAKGIRVRLVHAGADGFQALAVSAPWICSLNVDAKKAERMRCTPLNQTDGAAADSAPPAGILHTRPAADSAAR